MSKHPPPAPTASAVGPCPTVIQVVGRPRHWKFTRHHRTTRPPPLILKASTKFRIERNSFASTFKSKLHLVLFYASVWYICDFFLFHIEIEGKCGGLLGGQRVCCPSPSQIIGGALPPCPAPPPLPTPMIKRCKIIIRALSTFPRG